MRYVIFSLFILIFFLTPQTSEAFVQSFAPSNHSFHKSTEHSVFINAINEEQEFFFAPSFRTTSERFSFVYVTTDSAEFTQYNPDTIPEIFKMLTGTPVSETGPIISRYEYRNFGSSQVITLLEYLNQKGYLISEKAQTQIEQYIAYHSTEFHVIDVELTEDAIYDDEGYYGVITPFSLSLQNRVPVFSLAYFDTQETQFPQVNLMIHSDTLYVIPGMTTSHLFQITNEDVQPQCRFDLCFDDEEAQTLNIEPGNYITQQVLSVDPGEISILSFITQISNLTEDDFILPGSSSQTVYPELYKVGSGFYQVVDEESSQDSVSITPTLSDEQPIVSTDSYTQLLSGTGLLSFGSRGTEIQELQMFLNEHLNLQLVEDGIWGVKTAEAVAQFQTQYNLKIDGIVGAQTRSFISTLV